MIRLRDLEAHLRAHDAYLVREGAKHSVWRRDPDHQSTVPRHRELPATTARSICRQLGMPPLR
ncbi:type II toxin-antitoxin system HicA family toxin [Nitriliruptor sp.]|uniref:type II toxin-antitoxin system HicA family toxin n=1 Tax=Nitriliruptor sp. TaxID=2448056 RepID=UPI00349FF447